MKRTIIPLAIFCLFFLKIGAQTNIIFCDDFESGSLDPARWTAIPSANGSVGIGTGNQNLGINCLQMGKLSDAGGLQTQKIDLKLTAAELFGKQVYLEFDIKNFGDQTHNEDGIFLSNDNGATFTKIVDFRPGDWCDNLYGTLPPIDLTAIGTALFPTNWATQPVVIRFQQHDDGDFNNSGNVDRDGFFIDELCVYERPILWKKITPTQSFFDDFETGVLGNEWVRRSAEKTHTLPGLVSRPSSFAGIYGQNALNSQYCLLLGRRCDDGTGTNAMDLHFDLSGAGGQAELRFDFLHFADETQNDDGIYFSDNGGVSFKKAVDFKPSDYCANNWGRFPPIDIDDLAEKLGLQMTANFIIRFQQHDDGDLANSGAVDSDGFIFENVEVRSPEVVFSTLPFMDDFETGILGKYWAARWPDGQTTTLPGLATRPSNYADIWGSLAHGGQFSLALARRCDDGPGTNAIDLRLKLIPGTQVEMDFWIYDYVDETQKDDGIYFSNDGGKTFKKAFSFDPSNWCDGIWGRFPPLDVDELAAAAGVAFTPEFVIRFQQHDDGDLANSGAVDSDGFFLDDVHVHESPVTFEKVPYSDDFELGKFGPEWKTPFAEKIDPNTPPAVTRPSNAVEVTDYSGQMSQYGVILAKRCDDGFVTNPLDLLLNTVGASGLRLFFDLYDFSDEKHPQDGIFLSDDGGLNFKKVFDFNFDQLTDFKWFISFPQNGLNLDAAVAAAGLNFTKNFVIRFQQHGNGDLGNSGPNGADGMYIDNVNITAQTPTTAIFEKNAPGPLQIWPNPASETARFSLPGNLFFEKTDWSLVDMNGKLVKTGALAAGAGSVEIDLKDCPAGVFWLVCPTGSGVFRGKLVKI